MKTITPCARTSLGRRAIVCGLAGVCLGVATLGCAESTAPPPSTPAAPAGNPEPPDQPLPRQVEHEWMSLAEWHDRHRAQLADPARSQARVVFLGDSITQGWSASSAYQAAFAGYHPLGLGIGGDQTQHVLWRLADGALRGVHAEVVVILIGVNNLGNGHAPEETFRGVQAVVRRVEQELPQAAVLLLYILPTGETPADPLRQKVATTNRQLQALASDRTKLLDVGAVFLDANGRIAPELMADFLHPTAAGYERLTNAVAPELARRLAPPAEP